MGKLQGMHEMIEVEKMRASTAENLSNLNAHPIIDIFSVIRNAHVIPRDQDKFGFYINNYIDCDQLNQLYNFDWMEKGVQNGDVIPHKLESALTKVINQK